MYVVKINNLNKLFATFFILFLSVIAVASPLFTNSAAAASQTDFLDAIPAMACGGRTNFSSPYTATSNTCIGLDNPNNTYYWQLEVGFRGPVGDASVSATNGNNETIYFAQTDSTSTMYVSIHSKAGAFVFDGMGYGTAINALYGTCSNTSEKANTINITAVGNGKTQNIPVDLCSLLASKPNGIVKVHADSIPTDADIKSGNTSQVTGAIRGTLGIYRDTIPTGVLSAGDSRFKTPLIPAGVKSMTLTGTTTDNQSVNVSVPANSFTSAGDLTIGSLKQGIYSLEIHYSDQQAAVSIGGNQNLVQSYLGRDIKLTFNGIVIKDGDTWITQPANGPIVYYTSDGKIVDQNYLDAAAAAASQSCGSTVSGIGWIVCPIINSLSALNDGMWGLASGLLKVNPIRSSDNIYQAWGVIRNFANVAFVIVFLIVIFSQLSSAGISNYGVKKMLPRMIVGAILVNLSFVVIQIAVDVANILGTGIYDVIVRLAPAVDISWTTLVSTIVGTTAGGVLLAAGIPMLGGASTVLLMILPMIAVAALGLLAAVLTLIFRQAAIPILAILAPLAFVAYLLPNTESWYKKWQGLLIKMLMMYPLAALLFGGAQFAADTIINEGGWWTMLIGLIVLTLPLFSLPFLARQGGSILGKVGSALNGLVNKASKPINNWAGGKRELAEKKYMSTNPSDISKYNVGKRMRFSALRGKQADKAKGSAYDRMISENTDEDILAGKLDSKLGPETALREKDAAALRQKKHENELIESGAQNIRRTYGSTGTIGAAGVQGGAEKAFAEAFASGDRVKMLSAMSVLSSAGPQGIDKLNSSVLGIDPSQNPELFKSFQNELNSVPGLKSKDAALARLAYTEGGQLSSIAQDRSTYSGLSAADAASQTEASLRRIQATGGMLPSVAKTILKNDTLSGQLTPVTKKIIEDIASGSTTGSSAGSTKQAAEATLEQAAAGTGGTNPFIVDSAGVIDQNSARDRAEATAAQAAQGTAGDTPFIVDHSGTASQPTQAGDAGSHTDEQGRQTPDGTAEGYHDYFNH